ncbi:MAG: hypothetical protein ACYCVB_09790 [Bacilli bacterium]
MNEAIFHFWLLYKDSTAIEVPGHKEMTGKTIDDAVCSFSMIYDLLTDDLATGRRRQEWIVWYTTKTGDYVQYVVRCMSKGGEEERIELG